jgi:effector-binding domain-containing protein
MYRILSDVHNLKNLEPQLLHLNRMPAVNVHSMSTNPEEEALQEIIAFASANGLAQNNNRLFGRNIYPTDKPEPHGYEYFLTSDNAIKEDEDVATGEISGGLYAVLEIKNLFSISEGWQKLFSWIEANKHQPVAISRGKYGWVNCAFEEIVDWQQNRPPTEWVLRLWVQLKK